MYGISVKELDHFYNYCVNEINLKVIGLMVIPPVDQDPKKYFKSLKVSSEVFFLDVVVNLKSTLKFNRWSTKDWATCPKPKQNNFIFY